MWAQAIAACSTTRRNSSERLESITRQLAACRAIFAIAEQVIGLHQLVDLAGPFIDHGAFAVPEESAGRVFVGVPVGAMNLNAVAGGAFLIVRFVHNRFTFAAPLAVAINPILCCSGSWLAAVPRRRR